MDDKISLWEKVFSKRGYKFLLFLGSYVIAVIVMTLIISWDSLFTSEFLIALILFPYGFLGWPIFQSVDAYYADSPALIIGWLTYLVITFSAVFIKNHRTARTLFFIFVLLLVLNIYGCVASYEPGTGGL